nr:MAG TPA: Major tail protein [Bacteriophage sp.]
MKEFQHLNDTAYPGLNTNVYAYKNTFDYTRWGENVRIKALNVLWDGRANVPYFADDSARDAWFDAQGGAAMTLTSAINVLPDDTVPLPFPFSVASRYNYLMVEFPVMPSAGNPIEYEGEHGTHRFYFFLRAIEQRAANCTLCAIERDEWVTFANSCECDYLMLERGHAPMQAMSAHTFLENPLANNGLLLAPDVNYGAPSNVAATYETVLNDSDIYALIATSADPRGAWGSKASDDWRVPAGSLYNTQGAPTTYVFAVPVGDLTAFMGNIDRDAPQFKATVKAVFLVAGKLLSLGERFEFGGVMCNLVNARPVDVPLIDLDESMFGYDAKYSSIAKLYTSPYAHIEVTNELGEVTEVRIEDTVGKLELNVALSLSYPLAGIDAHLLGIGGSKRRYVTFRNMTDRETELQGTWYKNLMHWDVPTYSVTQRAEVQNDYATHYSREQQAVSYNNAYDSAVASANTAKSNADASADTSVANTANSGQAQTANTAIAVAANTATVARSNQASTLITSIGNSTSQAAQAYDAGLQRGVQESDASAVAATTLTNAIGNVAGSVLSGALSGNPVGAAAGLAGGIVSAATSGVNAAVMLNASSTKVELSISNSQSKVTSQNSSNASMTEAQTSAQTDNSNTASEAATNQTANSVSTANANASNSASTAKANAGRTQATSIANAGRARDTSVSAVEKSIKQAGLSAPYSFGSDSGGSVSINRPMLASANIVTQPKGAIAQAGDAMLRYGYALNQQWHVESFAIMPKFTYWKASEAWVYPTKGAPEAARERIKALLENGVTVWTNPDEVGKVTIYDNR